MLLPASRISRNDTAAVQLLSSITAVALGSVGSDGTVTDLFMSVVPHEEMQLRFYK